MESTNNNTLSHLKYALAKWKKAEKMHSNYMKEKDENNFDDKKAFILTLNSMIANFLFDHALKEAKELAKELK